MLTTTLRELRAVPACEDGMNRLIASLGPGYGDDTPIIMIQILDSNGLDHTHWALENTGGDIGQKILNLAACAYAERTLHLFEEVYPDDKRLHQAIEIRRKWIAGEASDDELAAARADADAAVCAAEMAAEGVARGTAKWAARAAARAAEWAAKGAAEWAEWASEGAAEWAEWASEGAAEWAVEYASRAAAQAEAVADEKQAQMKILRKLLIEVIA